MFEKFTDCSRRVMALANQQAQKLNQAHITPEHIFLGLLAVSDGIGIQILQGLKVNLCLARNEIEKQLQADPERPPPGQPTLDPVAKRIIDNAIAEAQSLNPSNYCVNTEHLLLGLMLVKDCVPAQVLGSFNVTVEKVRDED